MGTKPPVSKTNLQTLYSFAFLLVCTLFFSTAASCLILPMSEDLHNITMNVRNYSAVPQHQGDQTVSFQRYEI
jgi:hypothetical protein